MSGYPNKVRVWRLPAALWNPSEPLPPLEFQSTQLSSALYFLCVSIDANYLFADFTAFSDSVHMCGGRLRRFTDLGKNTTLEFQNMYFVCFSSFVKESTNDLPNRMNICELET